jgi:hydroxymethylglutaryl-CoA lyase
MSQSAIPQNVTIREVGPREGFQALSSVYPTEKKVELISQLAQSGLKHIEVTSMVRGDKVPQMADAEHLIATLPNVAGIEYTALYLNTKGFARAEATKRLSNIGWLYTSPSESFLRSNNNTTIAQSLSSIDEWVACFQAAGKSVWGLMVSTAFGCEFEGAIPCGTVAALIERFLERATAVGQPVHEVCLADTVGRANPRAVRELVALVSSMGVVVSLHLHDTWGLGLCNAYAGLEAGVAVFETSVGGLGGCPFTPGSAGNVATEDLVHLCDSLGVVTGLDVNTLCGAAEFAEALIGQPLPGHVYKTRRQKRVIE